MFGFTVLYNADQDYQSYFSEITKSISFVGKSRKHYLFKYQTNQKFLDDKLFVETDGFILGVDGVLLNLQNLKNSFGIPNLERLLLFLFQKYHHGLPQYLRGEFVGFIFNKKTEKLFYFINQTATKKAFYTQVNEMTLLSPSMEILTNFKNKKNQPSSLNQLAAYAMLTYGGLLGNQTLAQDINRLQAGEFMVVNEHTIQVDRYIDYNGIAFSSKSEDQLIDEINTIFLHALKLEYEKDKAYQYQHIATLSGGLDSRMNIMLAERLGYPTHHFCFSQSGYQDEIIGREISNYLKRDFQFIALDESPQVLDLEENVDLYEGQIFYLSSSHFNYALKQVNMAPYGLIHTGLIGDGVLGGLITAPKLKPPNVTKKLTSKKLFPVIQKEVETIAQGYYSEDTYNLYNRVFNVTNSGAFVCEQYSYLVSPFMYPEFMELCLSIPPKMKYNEKIYIHWINKLHPELTKFTWERTGFKPTHPWKTNLSYYTTRIKSRVYRFLQKTDQLTMTPYDYWYQHNKIFKRFVLKNFEQKIGLLHPNPTLKKDTTTLFNEGNVLEKSLVLTLLSAIQKYQLRP